LDKPQVNVVRRPGLSLNITTLKQVRENIVEKKNYGEFWSGRFRIQSYIYY